MGLLKAGWKQVRALCALGALTSLIALTGCPFFQCEGKADCDNSSTSTGTGDYVYVSNSVSGPEYINGYTIGTGTLTAVADSPLLLNYVPVAMAVSANNNFLYVAASPTASTTAGIWVYNIASTGELTGGTQETTTLVGAMALSPDGYFLYTLDSVAGTTLTEYPLNATTGALGNATSVTTAGGATLTGCATEGTVPASQSCSITVAPTLDYVAVALNANGVEIFPYTSSVGGGIGTTATPIAALSTSSADFSLAFDDSDFLYVASTAALTSYGTLASPITEATYSNYTSGAIPRSVITSTNYSYLYTADEGSSFIQEFGLSSGVPSAFLTPDVLGPQNVSALGVDRSGTYLLAAGYNTTNGLQMFTISSTSLTAVTSVGTGGTTTVPVVMALTH